MAKVQVTIMAKACRSKTKAGGHCQTPAGKSGYCFIHDPERSVARAAARKLGGYHRARGAVSGDAVTIVTVADVLTLINAVIRDAWKLDNSPARARVLLQAADSARGVLEVADLEARIMRLEQGGSQ